MPGQVIRIVCALLLLIAQQQALSHDIWHLGAAGSQTQAAGDKQHDPVKGTLCDLHASFSTVLGAASGSIPMAAPESVSHPCYAAPGDRVASFHAPVPSSRGPPALL